MGLAEKIAAFALAPVKGDAACAMMQLSLFDWAACALAGRDEPVAGIVRGLVLAEAGRGEASLVGGGHAPARSAAWVNGTISHALDYDDTHFGHIGHPSVAVVPAALAIAERQGASGTAFLEAALVGAETSVRVGLWLGRGHYQAGFHQTATAGAFGAGVAAGRLLGLNHAQMVMALAVISTRASGLKSQFGSMGKPLNAGIAAANGVEAALLAGAGFVSSPAALDGPQGFGPTHAGAGEVAAFDGLGQDWLFEGVSHKFHACCHGTHAMLEALAGADAAGLAEVRVTTHPRWLTVCNIAEPATGLEAKFSYRLTAAMALDGRATGAVATFSDDACAHPALVALRDRVQVLADDGLAETEARVELIYADGRREVRCHDLMAPLSSDFRSKKLRAKVRALVGERSAEALWKVTQRTDLAALATILRAEATAQ